MAYKRVSLLRVALWASALALTGCYAKSSPITASPEYSASRPTPPLPFAVGLRSAAHGDNVALIQGAQVAGRFAMRLRDANVFSDVIYPMTELSPITPDLILEVSVSSAHDLHPLKNLAKDIAVGLSLLLLQPLLPTSYDLAVEITALPSGSGFAPAPELRATRRSRFSFTWLRASDEAIERWHLDTTNRAIDAMIASVEEHYAAAARPETMQR